MRIPDSLSFESAAAIPEVSAQDRKIALRGLLHVLCSSRLCQHAQTLSCVHHQAA